MSRENIEDFLIRFEQFGLLTRIAKNRFFLPETIDRLREITKELADAGGDHCFTAAAFAQHSGIGRNLSIQILEYLDSVGATKRIGESRRLV